MEKIYKMRLHDRIDLLGITIFRVPGGWIYSVQGDTNFIPFDNEFMVEEKQPGLVGRLLDKTLTFIKRRYHEGRKLLLRL